MPFTLRSVMSRGRDRRKSIPFRTESGPFLAGCMLKPWPCISSMDLGSAESATTMALPISASRSVCAMAELVRPFA